MITLVKCKILDKAWKERQSNEITLDLAKARRLQSKGLVEILDKEKEKDCAQKIALSKDDQLKVILPGDQNYLNKVKFTNKKKIKIAWVQDYSKPNGGAELSNKHIVNIGETLGFDIVGVIPNKVNKIILNSADLIIINNFFEFPINQFNDIIFSIYENKIPYIKYDHDCREMKRCHFSRQLFTLSKLNIFLSPKHLEESVNIYGEQIRNHSLCLPVSIDVDTYKKRDDITRLQNSVIVPCYRKCKSNVDVYINENKHKHFFVIGDIKPNDNIEILRKCEPEEMPTLFSRYSEMLHLPKNLWAGERIYFEALLCGCIPIVNSNVGHSSWNFGNDFKYELKRAPFKFWNSIERCLNG